MKKISVVVVDDHKMIREMWIRLFAEAKLYEIVGESGDFHEAISVIGARKPQIVLLDINLPNASGLDAVPLIQKQSPDTKIIGVSMHNQPALAKKMLKLGAKGYVTKNSPQEEIFSAIDQVLKGNVYICTEIKHILSERALTGEIGKPGIKDLSMREIEVVNLLKEGMSSREIAEKLGVSTKTIEVHRYNILKKLDLKNTASLINTIQKEDPSF
jgi:two-component system invasion response regulator UvrY